MKAILSLFIVWKTKSNPYGTMYFTLTSVCKTWFKTVTSRPWFKQTVRRRVDGESLACHVNVTLDLNSMQLTEQGFSQSVNLISCLVRQHTGKISINLWLQSFFIPFKDMEIIVYKPSPGTDYFFNVYCLVQTFVFGTHVSRTENFSFAQSTVQAKCVYTLV